MQEGLSRRVNGRMDGQDGQGRAGSSLSRRHQQWVLSGQFSAFDAHDRSPRRPFLHGVWGQSCTLASVWCVLSVVRLGFADGSLIWPHAYVDPNLL